MTKREEYILSRMMQLQDAVRSGATEMVGKTYRGADGRVAGRYRSGFPQMFPELARAGMSPGEAARAVELGKGKRFKRLYAATEQTIERWLPEEARKSRKSQGRPTVTPHTGNLKCSHCGEPHTKGQHRFHGPGSFHATHLFAFNPIPKKRKAKRRQSAPRRVSDLAAADRREYERWRDAIKKNPQRETVIYDATKGVAIEGMQKGPRSPFAGQKFRHKFKAALEIIGLPNGDVLLRRARKKRAR